MSAASLEDLAGTEDTCSCGFPTVWTGQEWQHDAAPWRWGDDHEVDLPSPTLGTDADHAAFDAS
jgi:hypothetical protein